MSKRRTLQEKKREFDAKWSGKLDDKLIDYNLPIRTVQQFICLKNDSDHVDSGYYYHEDEKVVMFPSTLEYAFYSVNCCPIFIKQYSHKPPANKITQEEIERKIANNIKNIQHINGDKTILLTPHTNMQANHIFKCGCGQQFTRAMSDIFKLDRWLLCLNCAKLIYKQDEIKEWYKYTEPHNKLNYDEAYERIENHLNNKVNDQCKQTTLISSYTGMNNIHEFQCTCGNKFKRRMTDILRRTISFLCIECSARIALEWLDSLNIPHLITMRSGKEFTIPGTRYRADGFDPITNTIYEFHGCEFHGHLIIEPNCPFTRNKGPLSYYGVAFSYLYERTKNRMAKLIKLGYNYVEMWECEYKALNK